MPDNTNFYYNNDDRLIALAGGKKYGRYKKETNTASSEPEMESVTTFVHPDLSLLKLKRALTWENIKEIMIKP